MLSNRGAMSIQRRTTESKAIRTAFTMTSEDQALIERIRKRFIEGGVSVSKSEVVRAGLQALWELPKEQLIDILQHVEKFTQGRKPDDT